MPSIFASFLKFLTLGGGVKVCSEPSNLVLLGLDGPQGLGGIQPFSRMAAYLTRRWPKGPGEFLGQFCPGGYMPPMATKYRTDSPHRGDHPCIGHPGASVY